MAKTLVEYVTKPGVPGYSDRPMHYPISGRAPLTFVPRPEYDHRRVEEFDTEAQAKAFVDAHVQTGAFAIAHDLYDAHERRRLQAIIRAEVEPLEARIRALEGARNGKPRDGK